MKPDSIQGIYIAMRSKLGRAVMGIVPPKDIEDIVQETYVRVCQIDKKERIREPESFLYRIARNIALDHNKRAESRLTRGVDEIDDYGPGGSEWSSNDDTFEKAATDEEFAQFCESVRQLPVQCRRAFVLKKVYGYSQREISAEMKISESTVEKHIALGIRRCTNFMMHPSRREGSNGSSTQTGRQMQSKGTSHE